jgi:tetratricopeptide (TPR) repeat protein
VEIALHKTAERWTALLAAFLAAGLVLFTAGKIGVADALNRTSNPDNWMRAAEMEPGYGEYWRHLGFYRQYDFENANPILASEYYRNAVRDNPRSSHYWIDLGNALQQAGHPTEAREAYKEAVANYPSSARVKWAYGNFLFLQNDSADGIEQLRQAILIDPKLRPLAISRCWQTDPNVNVLLNELLPPQPAAYIAALDFLASIQETDAALKVWDRLVALGRPFPLRSTFSFFDEMIQEGRAAEGKRLWQQAYDVNGLAYDPTGHSAVWNGGFEHDIANGGFGWRIWEGNGFLVQPDAEVAHSGRRSMRIDFGGGANADFYHLFQYVPVEPGKKYHLSAWLRTKAVSTDSGIRFLLEDANGNGTAGLLTPSITGTTPWTRVEADIESGPKSHVLKLQVRRLQSQQFDNRIEGTAWVDDVSLIPAGDAMAGKP